jgi:hypothetical protein
MSSKKKDTKSKAVKGAADGDDDWDDILAAQIQANETLKASMAPTLADEVEDENEDDDDDDADGATGGAKKVLFLFTGCVLYRIQYYVLGFLQYSVQDKKKKKKKGKKEPAAAAPAAAAPLSAAAKKIMEIRLLKEAEDARVKKLQDAEDERVRLENEQIAAEEKAKEEEKERKRKAKSDKKEAQIAAGTFMTKAEKEKAKKIQARLDSMKAAGIQLPTAPSSGEAPAVVKPSDLFKKSTSKPNNKPTAAAAPKVEAVETLPMPPPAPVKEVDTVPDDWDADDDDDWEANVGNLDLGARIESAVEDQLEVDNKKEQEKLRLLGIERAKREEENRIKKYVHLFFCCCAVYCDNAILHIYFH